MGLAWRDVWRAKVTILGIVLIVEVPSALLSGGANASASTSTQGYANFAAIFMNVALLYVFASFQLDRPVVGIRQAYYDGSSYVVRFLLTAAVLVLMLAPAALGAIIYVAGLAAGSGGSSLGEILIIAGVGIALALPSVWLLVRFGLATTTVVAGNMKPVAALKHARNLTLGRFWRVFLRLLVLILMLVLILLVLAVLVSALNILIPAASGITGFLYDVLSVLAAIPVANAYLVRLYRALDTRIAPVTEERSA